MLIYSNTIILQPLSFEVYKKIEQRLNYLLIYNTIGIHVIVEHPVCNYTICRSRLPVQKQLNYDNYFIS